MILSVSRRTDIPSHYSKWFFHRLQEGYVLVRNPFNVHQIGRISLSPDVVDGIVFWTKNPAPMLDRISELEKYPYYFQFTLTSYGRDVEPDIPSKNQVIIPAFQKLSKQIGKERVIWRYDPIFFNETYTMEYHCKYFRVLAAKLENYTEKCTVSFLDFYRHTARNIQPLKIQKETKEQRLEIMGRFSEIVREYGIYMDTCAEPESLEQLGIRHAHCVDSNLFERIGGYKLSLEKDANQRRECGCVSSMDIGAYHTCKNGCLYCYANYSRKTVMKNAQSHDLKAPLLIGTVGSDDMVRERLAKSCRDGQMTLFECNNSDGRETDMNFGC